MKICAENVRRNRYKYGAKRRICTGKWKLYGNNPEELYGIRGISSCEETEKKLSFENSIIIAAVIITLIPLILSYSIFISSKLEDITVNIKNTLKETGFSIAHKYFLKM